LLYVSESSSERFRRRKPAGTKAATKAFTSEAKAQKIKPFQFLRFFFSVHYFALKLRRCMEGGG
jgi:hypothetical protein